MDYMGRNLVKHVARPTHITLCFFQSSDKIRDALVASVIVATIITIITTIIVPVHQENQ